MTTSEYYELGEKAFDQDRYKDAIHYLTKAADDHPDAWYFLPLCYLNYASDVSIKASGSNDTETLVSGQQHAVALLDAGVRAALHALRYCCNSVSDGNAVAPVIPQLFNLQYAIVATGLTTAYRLTRTTTKVERTKLGDVTLWEEVVGTDTEQFVSLTSYDLRDYHVFGPDEKSKRVEQEKNKVLENAVQVATMLEYLGREYDAHMLRAAVACAMADCETGYRSDLLPADWFLCRAKEVARYAMDNEDYDEWLKMNAGTISEFEDLEQKYAALIRGFIREGKRLRLEVFYLADAQVPNVNDCPTYVAKVQQKSAAAQSSGGNDAWEIFLSVYGQVTFNNMIGGIVFGSVVSLFMGGLLSIFGPDANPFGTMLIGIWMAITLGLVYFRSITDDAGVTGKTFRIYQLILMGIAVVFSINFLLGIVTVVVLNILSEKYK